LFIEEQDITFITLFKVIDSNIISLLETEPKY
jgi:hypothetical protein